MYRLVTVTRYISHRDFYRHIVVHLTKPSQLVPTWYIVVSWTVLWTTGYLNLVHVPRPVHQTTMYRVD